MTTIKQLHQKLTEYITSINSEALNASLDEKLAGWRNPKNYLNLLTVLFQSAENHEIGIFLNFITRSKSDKTPAKAHGYVILTPPPPIPYHYLGYLLKLNKAQRELDQSEIDKDEELLINIYNDYIANGQSLSKQDYIELINYLAQTNQDNATFKKITVQLIQNTEKNNYWSFDKSQRSILQLLATQDGYSKYLYPLYRIEAGSFPSYFSNLVLQCYAYNDNKINTELEKLLLSYSKYFNNEETTEQLQTQLQEFHQFILNDENYSKRLNEERNKEILKGLMIAVGVIAALMLLATTLVVFPLGLAHIITYSVFLGLHISGFVASCTIGLGALLTGIFATQAKIDAPIIADRITKEITKNTGIQFFDKKAPEAIVEQTADSIYAPC
ncbi:MAG: DUF308 domain-containing protein [Proteobacteria bacterium]|nr:DUF308 domain-containing protein [Pseudomonadota bacterium]